MIMKNLPVTVEDEEIHEMFDFADKDKDGKLSFKEFQVQFLRIVILSIIYFEPIVENNCLVQ